MFCAKCGAQNDEHSLFCCQCGAQLTEPIPVEPEPPVVSVEAEIPAEVPETVSEMPTRRVRRKRSKKGLWIGLGAGVAGVGILATVAAAIVSFVVVLAIVIAVAFSSSPKSVVKGYMKATLNADMSKYIDLIPDEVMDKDMPNKSEQKEWVETYNETIQDYYNYLDYMYDDDWEITYKIGDIEDVPTELLQRIQEYYEERYDCKVKKAKTVELVSTLHVNGRKVGRNMTIIVIKVGGNWYLDFVHSPFPTDLLRYVIKQSN